MPRPGRADGKGGGFAAPTSDDEMQAEATRASALAAGNWLQEGILKHNNDRMIRTLRIEDLEGLASAAICGWLQESARQAHRLTKPGELVEMIRQVPTLMP